METPTIITQEAALPSSSTPSTPTTTDTNLPNHPTKEEIISEQIGRQSEYHEDFRTVHIKKMSPHGEINLIAHLGLPGGALVHYDECMRLIDEVRITLETRDLHKSKSNLTANMADLHVRLATLKDKMQQFLPLMQVPDGAISPSLRAVFIVVEKFLVNVRGHLEILKSRLYHPSVGLMMGRHKRSKIHTDCLKLNGILTLVEYSLNIYSQVSKNGRICPFLIGEELDHFDIEEYANSINIYPFLISINKHYQSLLRTAYSGLLKATAAAMHASHHSDAYGAFLFSIYNVYYFLFSHKAAAKCVEYFKEEDFCSGRFLWNLPESIVVKFFLKKTYKKVKFYKLFSIPFEDDDAEAAGASAKEAVLQAQNDSDVKQIAPVKPSEASNQSMPDESGRMEVIQDPKTNSAPSSPTLSNNNNNNNNNNIRISNTSTTSTTSNNSDTPTAPPLSPGGTVAETRDTVVSEKDNRSRWVEAQLLNERVKIKVPCLPESYMAKKLPVRMRIIFSKQFKNQAFVMNQKERWFEDKSYSINPQDSSTSIPPPNPSYSISSTSDISSNSSVSSQQPRSISNSSLETNVSSTNQSIPHSNSSRHSTSSFASTSHTKTHSRSVSESSASPSSVHLQVPLPPHMNAESGSHRGSIRRRLSVFRPKPTNPSDDSLSPALIVYYHGGGFIAMTSFSHEMYTRKWAVDTGVPILAVDYSLAPDETYPVQTAECFHAYKWALRYHKQIGSTAEKVILIGDSAGGNLVMGVVNRTILEGIRVPNGVVLAYPALLLQPTPSLSRLCSVIDPLLNMQVLLYVLRQYATKEYIDKNDPILSPVLATDDVLARYPPIRLIVGDMDPLLDDSIFMYKRLKALNKDVEISIQDGFGHGFLNFVGVIPQIHKMLDLVAIWLLEFIDGEPATRTVTEEKQNP